MSSFSVSGERKFQSTWMKRRASQTLPHLRVLLIHTFHIIKFRTRCVRCALICAAIVASEDSPVELTLDYDGDWSIHQRVVRTLAIDSSCIVGSKRELTVVAIVYKGGIEAFHLQELTLKLCLRIYSADLQKAHRITWLLLNSTPLHYRADLRVLMSLTSKILRHEMSVHMILHCEALHIAVRRSTLNPMSEIPRHANMSLQSMKPLRIRLSVFLKALW